MPIPELVAEPIKRVEEYYFGSGDDETLPDRATNDTLHSLTSLEVVS